jgi:small subunit ribosomal protein S13
MHRKTEAREGKGRPEEKHAKPRPEKAVKNIIRVGETNIDGSKSIEVGIRQIKGVSFAYARAIAKTCGFEKKTIGDLSESELKSLEKMLGNPGEHNIPSWFFNRRNDPGSGKNKHMITSSLELTHKMDIDKMKKTKTYRGVRHIFGLPVRGQRTRGSFRKGKVVGVSRKAKARQAAKSGK